MTPNLRPFLTTARVRKLHAAMAAVALLACEPDPSTTGPGPGDNAAQLRLICQFASDDGLFAGGARDGIPALVNPPLVPASHPDAQYVERYARRTLPLGGPVEARVVGLMVDDTPVAIPHNILWWHEIVNVDLGGRRLAITYCPLTGSALVFDATAAGTQRFGVSGLIFENNLVMFDEETGSLWSQMCLSASLGDRQGTRLVQIPATEMRWDAWKKRHPETLVVSSQTGFDRVYDENPYESYETSDFLLFGLRRPVDDRRPLKERVLGIPDGDGGIAIPFGVLAQIGSTAAFRTTIAGEVVQVLWDGEARAARAFYPRTDDGTEIFLRTEGTGFVDNVTGSTWNVEGRALEGPLAGSSLVAHEGSFVAFWFAWSAFHPKTLLWTSE